MTKPSVTYCRRWNFRSHRPIDPFTPAEAQACDTKLQTYSVVMHDAGGGNVPEAVIEIDWKNDFAGVWFFDEFGRQSLNYAFRRHDSRLFLFDVIEYTYPDDQAHGLANSSRTEELTFQTNGLVRSVITDDTIHQKVNEERSGVDVAKHWEPVPQFGNWESLSRWNRG